MPSTHDRGKGLVSSYQVTKSYSLILKFYIVLIPGVWIHQLQVMGESAIYPSLPKAWTPVASTNWKYLLYFPFLTSSWCKISLQWIFFWGKKRRGQQHIASWVSWSTKAFLSSLPWSLQGSWKEEMIGNRSKLTVRTSACWLLHPLRWADRPGGRCLRPDTRLYKT